MGYKVLGVLGLFFLGLVMLVGGVWGTLAIYYAGPVNEVVRYVLVTGFGLVAFVSLILLAFQRFRWPAFGLFVLQFLIVLVWFEMIIPSNDRVWQEDVALLPFVTQDKNLFTVHNVRNNSYRSETDYTLSYYDKTYDLEKLVGVDIISVYWMGPAVAHVFVSFVFSDGKHLAVSIETRKEKGEEYSTIRGFFRQYELHYVVADERDVIGLRTNYRFDPIEDVYIYPMAGTLKDARELFLTYVREINNLKENPEFYNTLTTNCTTNIWINATEKIKDIPFSWKILASGYVPEYLYENGRLQTNGLTFEALRKSVHVNARALKAGVCKDFSRCIRTRAETNTSQ